MHTTFDWSGRIRPSRLGSIKRFGMAPMWPCCLNLTNLIHSSVHVRQLRADMMKVYPRTSDDNGGKSGHFSG